MWKMEEKLGFFPKWFSGLKVIVLLGVNANEIECAAVIARICVGLILYKNLGRKFWWYDFIHVHALRDTSPKLKDFIAYFFPKGFPPKKRYQIRKKSFSSFIGSKFSPLSTYSTKTNLKYDPNHARGHPYIYYAYYYYTTLWRRRKQGWKVSAEPSWGWRLQPTYNSSTSLYCSV